MRKIDIACIIDDDPIFVFATKKLMQIIEFCNGFLVFHNGQEAINYLKPVIEKGEQIPEIILLDLNMPVMDGWEFLDEFTLIPADRLITIYIVTSSIDPADLLKATKYQSINNYIIKPVTPTSLKEILENFS